MENSITITSGPVPIVVFPLQCRHLEQFAAESQRLVVAALELDVERLRKEGIGYAVTALMPRVGPKMFDLAFSCCNPDPRTIECPATVGADILAAWLKLNFLSATAIKPWVRVAETSLTAILKTEVDLWALFELLANSLEQITQSATSSTTTPATEDLIEGSASSMLANSSALQTSSADAA